jgi:nifR3 family TIM-barrel protein
MLTPLPSHTNRTLCYGSLELPSRFNLAPLAGYTNLPFRLSVRELGGLGLGTTDLVNARALLEGAKKTHDLIATVPEDRPFAVQIFGSVPSEMVRAAQYLEAYGASSIDINMGCPVRKVVRTGGGSALMCDVTNATALVATVVQAVQIPVTVKMRLGWDDDNLTAPALARAFEQVGVAAITVHGRTREQGFGGKVKLDGIRSVVEAVERVPVIGNGDVRTIADAERMLTETGCAGIAIGRGALLNPWFFRQLTQWERTGDPGPRATWLDRLDFMAVHYRRLVEWRGEYLGCLQFRKVANWYCKTLRTGKEIQKRLMLLESAADFAVVVAELRERGAPPDWVERDAADPQLAVPSGPIDKW